MSAVLGPLEDCETLLDLLLLANPAFDLDGFEQGVVALKDDRRDSALYPTFSCVIYHVADPALDLREFASASSLAPTTAASSPGLGGLWRM